MNQVILRAAEAAELAAVLEFWQVAAENDSRPVDTGDAIRALHQRDPAALILAVDGAEIVGTVIAGWDGWRCHVYRLAVSPQRRREGIGGRLVAAAEERFAGFGGTRADAMVLDGNTVAHGIWAAHGYRPQDEWSRWVKPMA